MSLASIGSLYTPKNKDSAVAPDAAPHFGGFSANPDFVLCRNKDGNPTAVYKDNVWDFNPYRLSAKKINRINFDKAFDSIGAEQKALINEAKYVLYCLIYFGGGGRLGRLSASSLSNYWFVIRAVLNFCYRQKENTLVGVLSLRQVFTSPIYLAAFVSEYKDNRMVVRLFSSILGGLVIVGENRLGYRVVNTDDYKNMGRGYHQHPVIPTRIYLELINKLSDLLTQMYVGVDRFDSFIEKFEDKYYGMLLRNQQCMGLGGKAYYRPDMVNALELHRLDNVFVGEFICNRKRDFSNSVLKMQYVLKQVIHLYTGMRDQEVMRMPYDCLSDEVYIKESVDDAGVVRDSAKSVSIISTTTKFSGYRQSEAWFAPNEVVRAVKIAQAICRGLAKLYKINTDLNCPLFLNPSILRQKKTEVGVGALAASYTKIAAIDALVIEPSDLVELSQTDTARDFYNEPKFAVGQSWPLSSHQFRRSFAFYASNSGFVSLPSLKSQYKHLTIEMARYYSNGFENLRTIFGYYDAKRKEYVLPASHVALEFQMGMPMAVANQLLSDVLFKDDPLFGGTGSYMEKQKARLIDGEVCIEEVRAETITRVKRGDIKYRPTLLGGCTKVGRCDAFLLGDYTECLSCEGSIIKSEKLSDAIESATAELASYVEDSGEYQITKADLERLLSFKARLIDTVGLL